MTTVTVASLFTIVTILCPPSWLASVLQLTPMTLSFGFLMIAIAIGNFAAGWLSEKVVFMQVRNILDRFNGKRHRGKMRKYQVVEERMR
jgi:hypothetical protein